MPDTTWQRLTYSKHYLLFTVGSFVFTCAFLACAIFAASSGWEFAIGVLVSGALWIAVLLALLDAFVFPVQVSSIGLKRELLSSDPVLLAWPDLQAVAYNELGGYFVFRSRHTSIRVVAYADGLITITEFVKRYAPEAQRERAWLIPHLSKSTEAA